jgi:hypothetical protein
MCGTRLRQVKWIHLPVNISSRIRPCSGGGLPVWCLVDCRGLCRHSPKCRGCWHPSEPGRGGGLRIRGSPVPVQGTGLLESAGLPWTWSGGRFADPAGRTSKHVFRQSAAGSSASGPLLGTCGPAARRLVRRWWHSSSSIWPRANHAASSRSGVGGWPGPGACVAWAGVADQRHDAVDHRGPEQDHDECLSPYPQPPVPWPYQSIIVVSVVRRPGRQKPCLELPAGAVCVPGTRTAGWVYRHSPCRHQVW